jgi:quercetin dioxygenase-like cupin family protein
VSAGRFDELAREDPFPGIVRRALTTEQATVTEYRFTPGATFPAHFHPQEQITLILEGDVQLTSGDETRALAAGSWSVVAGGVPHGITAGPSGTRFLAILVPRRDPGDAYTLGDSEPTG